jgi:hypothetical protein
LFKSGLGWFAKLIFVEDIKSESDLDDLLAGTEKYADEILRDSELLKDLDLDSEADGPAGYERIQQDQSTKEWWALLVGTFNAVVRDAIQENNARKAAWAMRASERARAMCVFKIHLEEVVWMGHSASRLVDVIKTWRGNKTNPQEDFWQQVFKENPYVLTQIFAVPVVFVGEKAYVGGMTIDRQDAKFVDYLYANDSSNDALLVEIKTPTSRLLGSKYRTGVYRPSAELSGAIVQALDYRRELSRSIRALLNGASPQVEIFNPRCIIVTGNATDELDSEKKRKSFELFRTSLKDVEIITYDELFKKAETLASLFNLVAKAPDA